MTQAPQAPLSMTHYHCVFGGGAGPGGFYNILWGGASVARSFVPLGVPGGFRRHNTSLQVLWLSENQIGDAGAAAIVEGLRYADGSERALILFVANP